MYLIKHFNPPLIRYASIMMLAAITMMIIVLSSIINNGCDDLCDDVVADG